jgi:tetratricopeptide (TPR) repeat protein
MKEKIRKRSLSQNANLRRNKDEVPKKIYPYEEFPPKPLPPTNIVHVDEFTSELNSNTFPSHYCASQCNSGVGPCIIKEVLFPPTAPQEFSTLIESALVYQNTANYEMALATFEEARDGWREMEGKLRPEIELFFELSLGSVYESSGRDEMALAKFLKAKEIKLVYNHPDQAFPYWGLGSVLFHMEEPRWALRAYLKAREIREERLGGDTVDTATVYNNLGWWMMTLDRNQEAFAFFELSAAIFEVELGSQHERTLTANRNIKKWKRTVMNIKPEYPTLWSFAAPNPLPKLGKKKKKKKGKKKK